MKRIRRTLAGALGCISLFASVGVQGQGAATGGDVSASWQDLKATALSVQGKHIREAPGDFLKLRVGLSAGASTPRYEALSIYLEPGHQLLFSQWAPWALGQASALADAQGAQAFATVRADLMRASAELLIPAAPLRIFDESWVVVAMRWAGRDFVVAQTPVGRGDFGFKTNFEHSGGPSRPPVKIQHCCSGVRCAQLCANCQGPGFFCNLITCEIECIEF